MTYIYDNKNNKSRKRLRLGKIVAGYPLYRSSRVDVCGAPYGDMPREARKKKKKKSDRASEYIKADLRIYLSQKVKCLNTSGESPALFTQNFA